MKKGFTLLEVLVSAIILIVVVSGSLAVNMSVRRMSKGLDYHYTALNIAKQVLEFGEAGDFEHQWKMKYYYPAATTCTIPGGCDNEGGCHAGLSGNEGYSLKEWWFFCADYPQAFTYLGDIKAKGLVPTKAPDSVVVYTTALQNQSFYNAYIQTVEVQWKDEPNGETKKETLAVIPIRQRNVNDQLRLVTAEFWWE